MSQKAIAQFKDDKDVLYHVNENLANANDVDIIRINDSSPTSMPSCPTLNKETYRQWIEDHFPNCKWLS